MTKEQVEFIHQLTEKVDLVLEKYEESRADNAHLSETNTQLEETLNLQRLRIQELEGKYESLKMAKALDSGAETHDAKIKINRMVREIDKCIALLNQ